MAVQHRLVRCRPDRVWEVLRDGSRYADWVVGTHDSWEDDGRWPQEGAALRYRIKMGPWRYEGRTIVRAYEPPHRLELEAMAAGRVSARIAIEVRPWGEYTLIILDEHPLRGRGNNFHLAAIDAVAQV
ncbi:SRPBCC family protein, partial [Streptomyces sp. NPDC044571]|uniref:SRPBCC family protein n=1 Tax=Streptomyces sp. NPDC044571 TaxID=3155371 RepID=UPI0033D37504